MLRISPTALAAVALCVLACPGVADASGTAQPARVVVTMTDRACGTHWNSAGPPGGWIEIDLGAQHDISLLRLVVAQTPPGRAVHKVYGRATAGGAPGTELYELDASTVDGQNVEIAPASPWSGVRYLRIHTVWGPSWPVWREIQVFKAL